ncbi:RdgB/HAM1 family non-canonical purine NTP pyrophosphatase [Robiginitalea sp.]|uniref:RdgB/HAM1 family non-canonical purine NTP pyrophosphatase n=1 Tax=Robiginitalea sp. TaxID=1902411 RepID=UPI003C78DAA9
MKQIVFATHNLNKLAEIQPLIPGGLEVISLDQIGCVEAIAETATTLEGNAQIKASYIWKYFRCDCFADDTGLEVQALQGAPGVYSARFAGPEGLAEANMAKLLTLMKGETSRRAQFRTVIALILGGNSYLFEGVVAGKILEEPRGDHGFGYDPVFQPDGSELSFAQMTLEEKNKMSHRARAIAKLCAFLENIGAN